MQEGEATGLKQTLEEGTLTTPFSGRLQKKVPVSKNKINTMFQFNWFSSIYVSDCYVKPCSHSFFVIILVLACLAERTVLLEMISLFCDSVMKQSCCNSPSNCFKTAGHVTGDILSNLDLFHERHMNVTACAVQKNTMENELQVQFIFKSGKMIKVI